MLAADWLPAGTVQVLAWTLLHSLWQFTLVALAVAALLPWLGRQDARARHGLCLVGLALMALLPLLTFALLASRGAGARSLPLADAFVRDLAALPTGAARDLTTTGSPAWTSWLTGLWALGAAACLARTVGSWRHDRRLSRAAQASAPAWLQHACDQLARDLGLACGVRIALSSVAAVPAVVGWSSPVVLLPIAALEALRPDQLRAVLAHELAHVARHDALVNLFQACLEALCFFHPAVWWLSGRLRTEREYCCDDLAVAASGDALVFARALSTLDALAALPTPRVALSSQGGPLMDRISRLLGRTERPPTGRLAGATLGLVMLGAVSTSAAVLADDDCLSSGLAVTDGRVELSLDESASDCTLVLSRSGEGLSVVCAQHPDSSTRLHNAQAKPTHDVLVEGGDGETLVELHELHEPSGDGKHRLRMLEDLPLVELHELHEPGGDGKHRLRMLADLPLLELDTKLRALHLPEIDAALDGIDFAEIEASLEAIDIDALIDEARDTASNVRVRRLPAGGTHVLRGEDGQGARVVLEGLPSGRPFEVHSGHGAHAPHDAPHHGASDDDSLSARIRAIVEQALSERRAQADPGTHDLRVRGEGSDGQRFEVHGQVIVVEDDDEVSSVSTDGHAVRFHGLHSGDHQAPHVVSVPHGDGDVRVELRGLPSASSGELLEIAPRVIQRGEGFVVDLLPQTTVRSRRAPAVAPDADSEGPAGTSRYRVIPLGDGEGKVILDLRPSDDEAPACDGAGCCQHADDDTVSLAAPRDDASSSLGGLLRSALSLIGEDDDRAPAAPPSQGRAHVRRVPAPAVIGRTSVSRASAPIVVGRADIAHAPPPVVVGRQSVARTPAPVVVGRQSVARTPAPVVVGRQSVARTPAPVVVGRTQLARTPSPIVVGTVAPLLLDVRASGVPAPARTGTCLVEEAPVVIELETPCEVEAPACEEPCADDPQAPELIEAVFAT